jgi:beta-N-acetylhexosaminidase
MIGHLSLPKILSDPNVPASLSKEVVTDWLRTGIGFTGLIVTDDLSMGAIRKHYSQNDAIIRAILAGNDVLIIGAMTVKKQKQTIKTICDSAGPDSELYRRILESRARVMEYKKNFGILDFKPIPPIQDVNGFAQHARIVTELLGHKADTSEDVLGGRAKATQ